MSESAATPRFRITKAFQQIFSPFAVSTETLVSAFVPIVLSNLVLDFGREKGNFATWLLISLCGYLAMLVVPVAVRLFLSKKRLPAVTYALIFLAAGTLRGITIYAVGREAGVIGPQEWGYRLLGSPMFVFVTLSLVTVLVSNSVRATQELETLETSRLLLEKRLSSMRGEISRLNAEVAGRVSGLISPVIQQLMQNLKGAKSAEIGKEVQALRSTVDDIVRPLSLDIAQSSGELSDTEVARAKVSLRQDFSFSEKIQPSKMLLPFWSSVLITLVSTPAALVFYLQEAVLALAIFAVVTYVVLELVSLVLRSVSVSTVAALAIQVVAFTLSGITSSVTIAMANLPSGSYPVGRIVTLSIIIGVGVFIGQLRQTQRVITQIAAREVNAQLELLNSQARRELWLNRRRIATVLHGPVQAALYASAMRLAQAARPTKKLIQTVNADLESALEVLKFDSLEAPDLKSVLAQIGEVWSGNCEIYLGVSKNVYQITKKNALLSEAVVEVLREGISNAIKHGQATEIDVEAKVSGKLIELSIVNNGKAPVNKAGNGFGSKLYDELTLAWQLSETADGRTKFGATIFIA